MRLSSAHATKTMTRALWLLLCATAAPLIQADVSQTPLSVGGDVPGSLALVPSVEWPTVMTVANLGSYSSGQTYSGYFDSAKCYVYQYSTTSLDDSYFVPAAMANSHKCTSGTKQWSGNFLNWVATPTIDPFRSALTGGNRVKDTENLTVLQKARNDGKGGLGNRMNDGQGLLPASERSGAVPFAKGWDNFYTRLDGQNFDMLFSNWNDRIGGEGSVNRDQNWTRVWVNLNPNDGDQWTPTELKKDYKPRGSSQPDTFSVYRVRIQVKVCDPTIGVEANCKRYSDSNYKPEGLLQGYSDRLRYSVFSYLNDSSATRDGGVLRAKQSYIAPLLPDRSNNVRAEWSGTNGVLVRNPAASEAAATGNGIGDSGIINYLNKFGSMPSSPGGNSYKGLKDFDPVSELYYTALRYFKGKGNVPQYSNLNGGNANANYAQADGFPVVTNWYDSPADHPETRPKDPITYSCQKNVILGIGDTNTWNDKNLPSGTSDTNSTAEPPKPDLVKNDDSLNVLTATTKVAQLEGVPAITKIPFGGLGDNNSAYIAGMAYDAHTRDQRSDLNGSQTISTYWVDVRENQQLAPHAQNQYWLAAKYGGFTVPNNFLPYETTTVASSITDDLWWSGQYLTNRDNQQDKRPNNFFVASDAQAMVTSLKSAFARIGSETSTTTAALGSNSTQLNTGSLLFQSSFSPRYWSGDLIAKTVGSNGTVSTTATWSAASKLDNRTTARNILTITPPASGNLTTSGATFSWDNLSQTNKAALLRNLDGSSAPATEGTTRVDYLKGNRTSESGSNALRTRGSRLGDIVNSDPLFIGKPDYGYNLLPGSEGSSYLTFRQGDTYKNRLPLVVVGANDGMLHGFNATADSTGGGELFAYVPHTLHSELYKLTQRDYSHRYYVDGSPASSDVWDGSNWRTLVVGTLGAGGKAVFALDVTDPSSVTSSSVLWEFSPPEMRYPIQKPAVVRLANGKFGVIVTSGFSDGAVDSGKVWILNANTGALIKEFTLSTTGGLGEPLAIDVNNDRIADRLYVGDTTGNLWRFNISSASTDAWVAPTAPMFVARTGNSNTDARQPITAPLNAALSTGGYPIILFGTGSYYRSGDNQIGTNPRLETFYGIVDKEGETISRSDLVEQSITRQVAFSNSSGNRNQARAVTNESVGTDDAGWYIDLTVKNADDTAQATTGERVVSQATLRGGALIFTTLTPSTDLCAGGGTSWLMALDVQNGGRLNQTYFDYNNDRTLSSSDNYLENGESIPYSGISDASNGIIKAPGYFDRNLDQTTTTDLVCYTGSANGQPQCSPVPPGTRVSARASWREIR